MDDLDDLLSELGKPAASYNPGADALDDLDGLLGELSVSKQTEAPASSSTSMQEDDLDDLLSGLESATAASSSVTSTKASQSDDLDDLLSGLDEAPPPTPPNKPKPPASDDLDDLLSGLDEVAAPAAPKRTPAASSGASASSSSAGMDDLDALMNDLDGPTARAPAAAASRGSAAVSEIDGLLGDLDSGARSAGGSASTRPVSASGPSRGVCAGCDQAIHGEVLSGLGKLWHPSHFACKNCHTELGTAAFYEHEGMPVCDRCYRGLFVPRCAKCDQSITEQVITALGKKWHKACFTCATCNGNLLDMGGSFKERGGYPYCKQHYDQVGAQTCSACGKAVRGEVVNAGGRTFHASCFQCAFCQCAFSDGVFFEIDGKPYCKLHYAATTGAICDACGRAITGRVVNAMGKSFHPEHYCCAFCSNPIDGRSKEKGGKPYCMECHQNLFE